MGQAVQVAVGVVAGIMTGNPMMIIGAIMTAFSGVIGGKPKPPKIGPMASGNGIDRNAGILVNKRSSVSSIPVVYGNRRVGGPMVFVESGGAKNEYLHLVVVLSEGPINAINTVYIDGEASDDEKFNGLVLINKHLGDENQTADTTLMNQSSSWSNDHRLRGVAYLYLRLKWSSNAFSGLPTITADVEGRTLFDPRDGITKFSENPALAIRDYLVHARYGRGLDPDLLDADSFITAANYCEQEVLDPDGSRPRYQCNGVVMTDETGMDNMTKLLSSCRGMLSYSGGQYQLLIDKPEVSVFHFDHDTIVGNWTLNLGGKRNRINRTRMTYYNPEREWQPDIITVDSETWRESDNGLLLEQEVDLPFTTNGHMAHRIGLIAMKGSRQSINIQFTATLVALQVEIGEVITLTHDTPGWESKKFRVTRLRLTGDDQVEVQASEYADSVYDIDQTITIDTAPNTNLPDTFSVQKPGIPVISTELYETRGGSGVKAKAIISWAASEDVFVNRYQLSYKLSSGSEWETLPEVADTRFTLYDLAPGTYDFTLRAINHVGVMSDAVSLPNQELLGLTVPPVMVTGLTISAVGGLALLRWDSHPDLDVRMGGSIVFRHSPQGTGSGWSQSTTIGTAVQGSNTTAVLPLKAGTYFVKAEDSSGVMSVTAASIVSSGASILAFTQLQTLTAHTAFLGEKSGAYVKDDTLRLTGSGLLDDLTSVDGVSNWDLEGGVRPSGTYDFATGIDLLSEKRVRLSSNLLVQLVNSLDTLDLRTTLMDSWSDFEGVQSAGADATVWMRETDDDPSASPTWSSWQRLDASEHSARGFQFQCRMESTDPAINIHVSELSVTVDEVQ